jgi:uncharacterized membrane protein
MTRYLIIKMDLQEPLISKMKHKKCLYLYISLAIIIVIWSVSLLVRHINFNYHVNNKEIKNLSITQNLKIFEKFGKGNKIECHGDYCSYVPKIILCSQLNDVPEESIHALWKCEGKTDKDYEIDTIDVKCIGGETEHNPREGCILYITMKGPWSGYTNIEVVIYYIFMAIFVLIATPVLVVSGSGGGGGGGISSAFG